MDRKNIRGFVNLKVKDSLYCGLQSINKILARSIHSEISSRSNDSPK